MYGLDTKVAFGSRKPNLCKSRWVSLVRRINYFFRSSGLIERTSFSTSVFGVAGTHVWTVFIEINIYSRQMLSELCCAVPDLKCGISRIGGAREVRGTRDQQIKNSGKALFDRTRFENRRRRRRSSSGQPVGRVHVGGHLQAPVDPATQVAAL
jgi:hypothetical protein